jgi:type IV secretion system protein TrbL
MIRILVLGAILLLAALSSAHANPPTGAVLDGIVQQFQQQASSIQPAIYNAALELFGWLAVITVIISFVMLVVEARGSIDLGDVMMTIVRQILYVGFFYWLLTNSLQFSKDIIESFQQIATTAGATAMTPSQVITAASSMVITMLKGMSINIAADLAILVFVMPTYLCMVVVAAWMVLIIIEAYMSVALGALALAFGGLHFSKEIAVGFIRFLLAIGMKFMTLMIVASMGVRMITGWVQNAQNIQIDGVVIIFGCAVVLAILSVALPKMATDLISGRAEGVMTHGHARGAVSSAVSSVVGSAAIAAGEFALAVQSFQTAVEQLKEAAAEDNTPQSRLGRAALMLGGAVRSNLGARAQSVMLGARTGGRAGAHSLRAVQVLMNERRVRVAENRRPDPPADPANQT